VKRLSGRLVCRGCSAVYHVTNNPPKNQGVCDACGGELFTRNDDKEETIIKRFEVYAKETAPLIEYYKDRLVRVDGTGGLKEVFASIKKVL